MFYPSCLSRKGVKLVSFSDLLNNFLLNGAYFLNRYSLKKINKKQFMLYTRSAINVFSVIEIAVNGILSV